MTHPAPDNASLPPGQVSFVGAGPGDPGLLTLKGAEHLAQADVVLYDELLDTRLLDLTNPACQRLAVGKRAGQRRFAQEEINALLIEHAHQGRRVVRLKGGDPFVYGRGGEEALALVEAGIPFEVVPGVTAASGATAYAGIPLTHRGLAATAVLATGHEDPARTAPAVDWAGIARLDGTLAVYMGSRRVEQICSDLIHHGRDPQTPAAAIEWGTWPRQRTAVSTLADLAAAAERQQIQPPALIVVGPVVELRRRLNWFEGKPLFGRDILVTRSREGSDRLRLLLENQGARVHTLPLLELAPPADWSSVDAQIDRLQTFAWVVFSSPNAVDFFCGRIFDLGHDARRFGPARIAAVGQATAAHLRQRGLVADLVPQVQTQEGLIAAFDAVDVADQPVLLPASAIGRPLLAEYLEGRGSHVQRLAAYRNRPPDNIQWPVDLDTPDIAVFASPSSVQHFCDAFGPERLSGTRIACIGPTTTAAAKEHGFTVHIQPQQSSIEALVQAICDAANPQDSTS